MAKYRLLAVDLDETLLTKDKRITKETKLSIARAEQAGVVVIFATGRGLERVENFLKELNLNNPMVLVNGAEVWKKPGQLWERHFINSEAIRTLYYIAEEAGAKYWGYNADGLVHSSDWTEGMLDLDWLKFGIRHDDINVINKIKEQVKGLKTLEVTSSAQTNLEMSAKGISKETGVRKVCKELNIKMKHVMAIGDNLNDFKLIQAAGLGVAMGNADDRLKEVADQITDTNEADGVAKAIQNFLL